MYAGLPAPVFADHQALQVLILCPDSDDSETLKGQLLEVEVASLRDTISSLKVRLADCNAVQVCVTSVD